MVKPIARLDRSSQMWGGLSGGETLRPELPADQTPEFSREVLREALAEPGDLATIQAASAAENADKHQGSLHQPALSPVAPCSPHAQSRLTNLGLERGFEQAGGDDKSRNGTVIVMVPVVPVDLIVDEAFPVHGPKVYHERRRSVKEQISLPVPRRPVILAPIDNHVE